MKNAKVILLVCAAVLFLASCRQEIPQSPADGKVSSGNTVEWIMPDDSIEMNGMNLFAQSGNLYFAADNSAKISLYVNADIGDDGGFVFDDGHEWLLVMETSFGNYPLFQRKYVPLGNVEYTAFNEYDGTGYNIFRVLVTVRQSASIEIYECVFDNGKRAFENVPVYNVTNINPIS